MRHFKKILTFMLLTSFFACEPPVTFSEPQPTNTNNLSRFPNRLQGLYISLADSSTLSIDEKLIQIIYDYDYRIHPNQIDSTLRIVGDTLVDLENNEKIFIKRDGDTLLAHIHYTDTLFLFEYSIRKTRMGSKKSSPNKRATYY